jgi:hypothetical protein
MWNEEGMTKREIVEDEQGAAVSDPPGRMTTAMIECRAPTAPFHPNLGPTPQWFVLAPKARSHYEPGATPQES